jgi:hypothetical protein
VKKRNDLLIGPKDKAVMAIKEGKAEEAIRCIEELNEQFRPLHDRYGDWIQCLLAFIADEIGEDAVEKALKRTFEDVYKKRVLAAKDLKAEDIVKGYCQGSRAHYATVDIEEDDEKFVIKHINCNSGGRIQKECISGKTKKAYNWSFNQANVPYYCCHESVFNNIYKGIGLDHIDYEFDRQHDDKGNPTGSCCTWTIRKK